MCRIRSCEHILRDDTGEGLGRPRQFQPTESVTTEGLAGMNLCIQILSLRSLICMIPAPRISQSIIHFEVFIHLGEES